MNSLRELQRDFARALGGGEPGRIAGRVSANGIDPVRRLGIYRNNLRCGIRDVLEAAFPVVCRLGGPDWFAAVAAAYCDAHPLVRGSLHGAGRQFAAFLEARLAGSAHAYFADVARLEWAYQETLTAAEAAIMDPGTLASVPARDYGRLVFRLHPAVRLVASAYPLLEIWRANRGASRSEEAISLDAGAARLLLVRRADAVDLLELPPGEFALIEAFSRGEALGAALGRALDAEPESDAVATLLRAARRGVFTGFDRQPQSHLATGDLP